MSNQRLKQMKVVDTTGKEVIVDVFQSPAIGNNLELSGSSQNNMTIKSEKHINLEPGEGVGDIQLKPGDDIAFYSHHRAADKQDEVSLKILDGADEPVKLQIQSKGMTLSTKPKSGTNTEEYNVNITTGNTSGNSKAYLKVRARAIDLRCEEHGGIALQPKGKDGSGHMNKIKFEHGGGDGLEFGTFNTEKSSLFTEEYRFNRDGVVKMATRQTEPSDKKDNADDTTYNKYVKQDDDFYDIIDEEDEQTTWHDIIKTASALNQKQNGNKVFEASTTSKGNLEIASYKTPIEGQYVISTDIKTLISAATGTSFTDQHYKALLEEESHTMSTEGVTVSIINRHMGQQEGIDVPVITIHTPVKDWYVINNIIEGASYVSGNYCVADKEGIEGYHLITESQEIEAFKDVVTIALAGHSINIESASDITLKAANKLELKGTLDFGSTFSFGETDGGISVQFKNTKKNAKKDCGVLKVDVVNNAASTYTFDYNTLNAGEPFTDICNDNVQVPAGETKTVAQVSVYDIAKFIVWAKTNNFGPWANE